MHRTISSRLGSYIDLPLGGPGSGNWGHAGRPGKRGGSAPGGGKIRAIREEAKRIAGHYKISELDDQLHAMTLRLVEKALLRDFMVEAWANEHPDQPPENALKINTVRSLDNEITRMQRELVEAGERLEDATVQSAADIHALIFEAVEGDGLALETVHNLPLDAQRRAVEAETAFVGRLVTGEQFASTSVWIQSARLGQRPGMRAEDQTIFISPHVNRGQVTHELGHWLEENSPRLKAAAIAYLKQRTKGERLITMAQATGDARYPPYEVTKPDRFITAYMGKHYFGDGGAGIRSTEILSVGLEFLYAEPARFALQDPDSFEFILRTLWDV